MESSNSNSSGRYPPQASPLPQAMTPAQRAVQTNPQLLSYCMSMHALGMGNRHIDSLLDSEKAQVTKDMQQRRNHGYAFEILENFDFSLAIQNTMAHPSSTKSCRALVINPPCKFSNSIINITCLVSTSNSNNS